MDTVLERWMPMLLVLMVIAGAVLAGLWAGIHLVSEVVVWGIALELLILLYCLVTTDWSNPRVPPARMVTLAGMIALFCASVVGYCHAEYGFWR